MDSPAGELCKHCNDIGCEIFNTAPKDCLIYECAYIQMDKASINIRPDKCGVIFEKISNKIFIGTIDPNQIKPQKIVMKQISAFLNDGYSVILYRPKIKKIIIFNTSDRTKESVWFEFKIIEDDRQMKLEKK